MLIEILRGTPIWVYVLFAWLLWNGIAQLRVREISIRRMWITPLIFIVWGLSAFAGRQDALSALLPWMLAALVGVPTGLRLGPPPVIDIARKMVRQPPSPIPLLRNLSLFGAHYVLQVAAVIQPARHAAVMSWDVAVSGFAAGYFLGWAIRFARIHRATAVAAPVGCAG